MRLFLWVMLPLLLLGSAATSFPFAAGAAGRDQQRVPLSGSQPFVTILCKFADVADEPEGVSYFEDLLGKAGSRLDRYWREVSYDRINLAGSQVVGWHILPGVVARYREDGVPGVDLDRLAKDCTAAADAEIFFPDYAGINLVFNYAATTRSAGTRTCLMLDGRSKCYGVTWLWPGTAGEEATIAHEMGHAFGLQHSSSGHDQEYANPWDVMSGDSACGRDPVFGTPPQHIIAYDKDLLGWIPAEKKFLAAANSTTTITLEQLAQPGPEGYLMAQIPIQGSAGHFYTVEARRRVGYDASLPDNAVIIHEIDTNRALPAHLVNHLGDDDTRLSAAMWTVGMVFKDLPNGIAVSIDGDTDTGFVVTIATGRPQADLKTTNTGKALRGEVVADTQVVHQAAPAVAQGMAQNASVVSLAKAGAGEDSYAVWEQPSEAIAGGSSSSVDVWFAHKPAAGSWESGVKINDDAGSALRAHPTLAVDRAGSVYVVWEDTRDGYSDIYFAYRPAGGSWGPNIRINDDQARTSRWSASIAVDGQGNAEAVWTEERDGRTGIRSAYRPADGRWQGDGAPDPDATAEQTKSAVALDGHGNAYVVWKSLHNCGGASDVADIMAAARPAGGTWQPAVKIGSDIGSGSLAGPDIAADEAGDVYVAWTEKVGANFGIFVAFHAASGGTQNADDKNGWDPKMRIGSMANNTGPGQLGIRVDERGHPSAAWINSHGEVLPIWAYDLK